MEISSYFAEGINHFTKEDLLPLVCAAAALRDEKKLRGFILAGKEKGIKDIELYESLLQNYLFTGYPTAMISLKILNEYIANDKNQLIESWNLNTYRERGTKNCKKVYGRKFNKLINNVKSFSPELSDWLLLEGYGKVMGRKGLSLRKRELNNVSVLTSLKFEDQLYSHINGALRTGSSPEQIGAVISNLKIFGNPELVKFGRKTLKKFFVQKGLG
ncbi:carboxymuconolactone decarboxylase family protein [Bacteroidota bacterium]